MQLSALQPSCVTMPQPRDLNIWNQFWLYKLIIPSSALVTTFQSRLVVPVSMLLRRPLYHEDIYLIRSETCLSCQIHQP